MNHRRGVTLLEVVIGLFILGLVLGPVIYAFSTVTRGTQASRQEMLAAGFATELLEQIRSLPVLSILQAQNAASLTQLAREIVIPNDPGPIITVEAFPGVYLLASPLPPGTFTKRSLRLDQEKTSVGETSLNLLRVTVTLEWEIPGKAGLRRYSAATHLLEP